MKSYFNLTLRLVLFTLIVLKVDLATGQEIARSNNPPHVAAPGYTIVTKENGGNVISEEKAKQPTTLGNATETERLKLWVTHKTFSSKKVLGFTLKQSGNYKLEVLNMQGTVVAVLAEGFGKKGEELTFQFKGENQPAGTYIGRLITANEVTSSRFILQ